MPSQHQKSAGQAVIFAWRSLNVVQCGYCPSHQIIAATTLLKQHSNPTDAQVDAAMGAHVCQCIPYKTVKRTVFRAAKLLNSELL